MSSLMYRCKVPSAMVPIHPPKPDKNAHQTINSKDDLVRMETIFNTETQTPAGPALGSGCDQVSRMLYHSKFSCNIPLLAAFFPSSTDPWNPGAPGAQVSESTKCIYHTRCDKASATIYLW